MKKNKLEKLDASKGLVSTKSNKIWGGLESIDLPTVTVYGDGKANEVDPNG